MSLFNKVPVRKLKRTPFNLGHPVKFTTEFGQEQPVCCEKIIPGDIIGSQCAHRIDFAPLNSKLLQEFRVKSESYFVPTRILWKGFEEFFVAENDSLIHPYFTVRGIEDSLSDFWDYFFDSESSSLLFSNLISARGLLCALYGNVGGVFSSKDSSCKFDFLRWLAYVRIMHEYYFDENLQKPLFDFLDLYFRDYGDFFYTSSSYDMSSFISLFYCAYIYYSITSIWPIDEEGRPLQDLSLLDLSDEDVYTDFVFFARGFLLRNYPKDYFVSALPWKQKGNTVIIPATNRSEVQFYIQNDAETDPEVDDAPSSFTAYQENSDDTSVDGYKGVNVVARWLNDPDPANNAYLKAYTAQGVGNISIEDFRTAYEVQKWLETNARGGTRYKEQILAHFGVKTKDSRLDRPEFVYGLTDVINHGDVFTTYQDTSGNGVPAESVTRLSGAGRSRYCSYKATEHGYFITLYCIFPKANYMQGIFRQGLELDKFDYFWPEFEHLGEQEIYQGEVNSYDSERTMLSTFGYSPRYSQYKSRQPVVRGEFVDNLRWFTLSRQLPKNTRLNNLFIQINPYWNNLNRCFNVVTSQYDKIYMEVYNNLFMLRPMSYYGIPRLVL